MGRKKKTRSNQRKNRQNKNSNHESGNSALTLESTPQVDVGGELIDEPHPPVAPAKGVPEPANLACEVNEEALKFPPDDGLKQEANDNSARVKAQMAKDTDWSSYDPLFENLYKDRIQFHPDDDLDRVLEHLHTKKEISAKVLAKCMPHLVADLTNGKVWPSAVAESIVQFDYPKKFQFPLVRGLLGLKVAGVSHKITPLEQEVLTEQETMGIMADLLLGLSQLSWWKLNIAIDQTCEKWASKLDEKLYGNKKGMFLKHCSVYKQTHESLYRILRPECPFDDGMDSKTLPLILQDNLRHATLMIGNGVIDAFQSCWECATLEWDAEESLQECPKCKTALYCSRACQQSAWCNGHLERCSQLSSHVKTLEDNINLIDESHASAVDLASESKFNKFADYTILGTIQFLGPLSELCPMRFKGLEGPSMEFFYRNLSLVQSEGWWVVLQPDTLGDYMEKLLDPENQVVTAQAVEGSFTALAWVLSHDHFGLVKERIGNSKICHQNAFAEAMNAWLVQLQCFCNNRFGMPAEQFLNLYHNFDVMGRSTQWARSRRDMIKSAYNSTRLHHFHQEQIHANLSRSPEQVLVSRLTEVVGPEISRQKST